jgi:hypothetical protein
MKIDVQRRNNQRQRMVIFSFGLFMLLYVASKDPNLPSEWTSIGVEKQVLSLASTGGYPDTQEAGIHAAQTDIKSGKPKFMLFGLIETNVDQNFNPNKVEYRLGGCVLGGPGYQFWKGYNDEIVRQGLVKG